MPSFVAFEEDACRKLSLLLVCQSIAALCQVKSSCNDRDVPHNEKGVCTPCPLKSTNVLYIFAVVNLLVQGSLVLHSTP